MFGGSSVVPSYGLLAFVVFRSADAQQGAQERANDGSGLGHFVSKRPAPHGGQADVGGGQRGDADHANPFEHVIELVGKFHSDLLSFRLVSLVI